MRIAVSPLPAHLALALAFRVLPFASNAHHEAMVCARLSDHTVTVFVMTSMLPRTDFEYGQI